MSSASSNIVFDDIFTINAIDKEGKKFDRGASTRAILGALLIPTDSLPALRPL